MAYTGEINTHQTKSDQSSQWELLETYVIIKHTFVDTLAVPGDAALD